MATITELVFYHGNCLDGVSAAYCHKQYSSTTKDCEAKYIPMAHNEINIPAIQQKLSNVDLLQVKKVYVLDFNLDKDCYNYLLNANNDIQIVVLDHHKTAKEAIEKLDEEFAGKNIQFYFNLKYSGAVLSYLYFNTQFGIPNDESVLDYVVKTQVPTWIKMVHDRDLWQWKYKDTKFFTTALFSKITGNANNDTNGNNYVNYVPSELEQMCKINPSKAESVENLIEAGKIMSEQYENQIQSIIDERGYFEVDLLGLGVKGYAVNASNLFSSELGSKLCRLDDEHKYAIIFTFMEKDRVKCSIRSTDDFDCSGIAKHFGGGGHPQASGFNLTFEQFQKYILGYK
jgi:phosphoesterase, DHHA1